MATVRCRRGEPIEVLASAARTATPTVDNYKIGGGPISAAEIIIDCTAASATPSVVFTFQGWDSVSGKKWTILASAAITGTGTTILRVAPELTASANLIAKDVVPNGFSFTVVHADSDSITYSLSVHLI